MMSIKTGFVACFRVVTSNHPLEECELFAVLDHLAVGTFAPIAADVGRDVADVDVADPHRDVRGLSVLAPAVKDVRDFRIGE